MSFLDNRTPSTDFELIEGETYATFRARLDEWIVVAYYESAIRRHGGNISAIARHANTARCHVRRAINRHPKLVALAEEEREKRSKG